MKRKGCSFFDLVIPFCWVDEVEKTPLLLKVKRGQCGNVEASYIFPADQAPLATSSSDFSSSSQG